MSLTPWGTGGREFKSRRSDQKIKHFPQNQVREYLGKTCPNYTVSVAG